jgi:hypothetical protein
MKWFKSKVFHSFLYPEIYIGAIKIHTMRASAGDHLCNVHAVIRKGSNGLAETDRREESQPEPMHIIGTKAAGRIERVTISKGPSGGDFPYLILHLFRNVTSIQNPRGCCLCFTLAGLTPAAGSNLSASYALQR